jgi:hypothetical protein
MAKTTKPPQRSSGAHIIGRDSFSKISAVEGIRTSPRVEKDFKEFDRQGLSAAERRRALASKYGNKH